MSKRYNPDEVDAAFELYLRFNGQNHAEIEREMHRQGFTEFKKERLKSKGFGANRREGWIEYFFWDHSLKLRAATAGKHAELSGESVLFETEQIRKMLFDRIVVMGARAPKDLIYQHRDYVAKSVEIIDRLEDARNNYPNCVFFLKWLLRVLPTISPEAAKHLIECEVPLLEAAESEFVTADATSGD